MTERKFIFHTDVGYVLTTVTEKTFSDVEDLIQNKAFAQAQDSKFKNLAKTRDINSVTGPRTISSSYIQEV